MSARRIQLGLLLPLALFCFPGCEAGNQRMSPAQVSPQYTAERSAIEAQLGKFELQVPIRIVENVQRDGQQLSGKSKWSGAVRENNGQRYIELRTTATSDDARFYLAHARIRERASELGCEAVRIGLTHYLRFDDGFDPFSWSLYQRGDLLDLRTDLDMERIKTDPQYRDSARGSCWAAVFYLAKAKHLTAEAILKSPLKELPNPREISDELQKLVKN